MRKNIIDQPKTKDDKDFIDLNHVYLSYNSTEGVTEPVRSRTAKTSRPKSGVPRYYRANLGN
jgi:hypothetical protein